MVPNLAGRNKNLRRGGGGGEGGGGQCDRFTHGICSDSDDAVVRYSVIFISRIKFK
jgi:hypothetical protein